MSPRRERTVEGPTRTVPGWTLRAAVALCGLLLLAAVLAGRSAGPWDALPALVVLGFAAALPGSPLPTVFLLLVGLAQLVAGGPGDLVWRLPVAAALVHGLHLLAALAAAVPARALLEVAVLREPARRWGLAQLLAAPAAVAVGLFARSGPGAVPGTWLAGAAVVVAVLSAVPLLVLGKKI